MPGHTYNAQNYASIICKSLTESVMNRKVLMKFVAPPLIIKIYGVVRIVGVVYGYGSRCMGAKVLGHAKFQSVVWSREVGGFSEVAFTLSLCKTRSVSQVCHCRGLPLGGSAMGDSTVYLSS